MNLTPQWQKIQHDNPKVHAALQRVAEEIYEHQKEPIRLYSDNVDLGPALEGRFLKSEDDGIAFSDQNVRHDYLARHAARVALEAWDDHGGFIDALWKIYHRTVDRAAQTEVLTVVLLVLAHDHGKDVVERFAEAAKADTDDNGQMRFLLSFYRAFCDALPELPVEPQVLADALDTIVQTMAGDLAGRIIYGAVEELAKRSRADAEALYEVLVMRPTSPVAEFAENVLLGLAHFDLPEAHRRALELSEATQPALLRKSAISALGRFDYASSEHPSLLRGTWEHLEGLRGELNPPPEAELALTRAYGNMLRWERDAVNGLVDLAARPDPVVQIQVAVILAGEVDNAHSEPWFKRALLNLARVSSSRTGTWQQLDYCAARCARSNPDLVVEFVQTVILSRDYGGGESTEVELPKMLGSTLSELRRHHPEALEEVITRWFASTERGLHRAARDVVHSSHDLLSADPPWLKLSKTVLDTLDEQTVVYALKRIMGYVASSRPLAALLLSATQRDSCSPAFVHFVASALSSYVLYNYPHEAGDYLRSRLQSGEATQTESEVATAALDQSETYFEALRSLPRLKEFQLPSQRLYLLHLAESKQQAAMKEEAEKQSVVMSLFSRIPLKYGQAMLVEREDDSTERSELNAFSFSVEKPRGEMIDPVGQTVQRMEWQSVGLHEFEDHMQDKPDEDTHP